MVQPAPFEQLQCLVEVLHTLTASLGVKQTSKVWVRQLRVHGVLGKVPESTKLCL